MSDFAPPPPRTAKRKRPFGVKAIILLSALTTLYSAFILALLYVDPTVEIPLLLEIKLEKWLEIYFSATIAVQILVIMGLWQMKRWGWFLVMLNTGLGMFLNIWAYFYARPNYVAMAVSVLIVFYMNQREVQQAFVDPEAPKALPATEIKELPAA